MKTLIKSFTALAPVLAALAVVTTVTPARAQTPFFLDRVGAAAEYVHRDGNGRVESYTRNVVTDISAADPLNHTVTYTVENFNKNRRSKGAPSVNRRVVRDGVVEMTPPPEAKNFRLEGEQIQFQAADMAVGQVSEVAFSTTIMGIKTHTKMRSTVVAREPVTTPAGTFDCFKIRADMTVTALGVDVKMVSTSWATRGVGMVKTELRDEDGELGAVQELISLE